MRIEPAIEERSEGPPEEERGRVEPAFVMANFSSPRSSSGAPRGRTGWGAKIRPRVELVRRSDKVRLVEGRLRLDGVGVLGGAGAGALRGMRKVVDTFVLGFEGIESEAGGGSGRGVLDSLDEDRFGGELLAGASEMVD